MLVRRLRLMLHSGCPIGLSGRDARSVRGLEGILRVICSVIWNWYLSDAPTNSSDRLARDRGNYMVGQSSRQGHIYCAAGVMMAWIGDMMRPFALPPCDHF